MKSLRLFFIFTVIAQSLCCCTMQHDDNDDPSLRTFLVYVINRDIHTGLLVPVNPVSKKLIAASAYFENALYIDYGWGEEEVYQTPNETLSMDLKAIFIPSSSVMCAEGLSLDINILVGWSDYAVEFMLTEEEFRNLCSFIDSSFTRGSDNRLITTSIRSNGNVIYFKSVHTYCLFNTCNTWIADALSRSLRGISPFMVVTKYGLYDEIIEKGTVLKRRKGNRSCF